MYSGTRGGGGRVAAANRIDTRVSSSSSLRRVRENVTTATASIRHSSTSRFERHDDADTSSPLTTPDLSMINNHHNNSLLMMSPPLVRSATTAMVGGGLDPTDYNHHQDVEKGIEPGNTSTLESLAFGLSPVEDPQRRPQHQSDYTLPTNHSPYTIINDFVSPPPQYSSSDHRRQLPRRPDSLPKRVASPPSTTAAAAAPLFSTRSSSPTSDTRHQQKARSTTTVATKDSTDILYNTNTKMYRDTEEELRKLKEDRQKIKTMLLELELDETSTVASSCGGDGDEEGCQSIKGQRSPVVHLHNVSPPKQQQSPPPLALLSSTPRDQSSLASPRGKTTIPAPRGRTASPHHLPSSISSFRKPPLPTMFQTKSSSTTAAAAAAPLSSADSTTSRSASATSRLNSTLNITTASTAAAAAAGKKLLWQQKLRDTPKEVIESHRSRLLGDVRARHAQRLLARDASVTAMQTCQREERERRRAAMGYGNTTEGGATANGGSSHHRQEAKSSVAAFLRTGSHISSSCATPPIQRYPLETTRRCDPHHPNGLLPTPSGGVFYDPRSALPRQTYAAALDTLSTNSLSSERYCAASVHERLQQLRLAVGCVVPAADDQPKQHDMLPSPPPSSSTIFGRAATSCLIGEQAMEGYLSVPFLSHQLAPIDFRRPGSVQEQWWRVGQTYIGGGTAAPGNVSSPTHHQDTFNHSTAPVAHSRFMACATTSSILSSPATDSPPAMAPRHHQSEGGTHHQGSSSTDRPRLQSAENDSPPWDRAVSGSSVGVHH